METKTEYFSLAVVVIFGALALPTLFVTYRHGVRGLAILGWGSLSIFCSLKIIGSAMQLANPQSLGAAIVNNIGLSPLLLAVAGVLHESQYYHATSATRQRQQKAGIATTLMFHAFIMLGLALVAVGTSKINQTNGEVEKAWIIARVGGAVMVVGWLALVGLATQSCLAGHLKANNSGRRKSSAILLIVVITALPFVGVRVVFMFTYLVTKNQNISSATAPLFVKIVGYLIHEVIATLVLVVGGLLSMNIARQPTGKDIGDTEAEYKMVQPLRPGELGAE